MIERETTFEAVARGETTLAELEQLTAAEAYAIADYGWTLLEQGRAEVAALLFETLALANPRHAYFHALHGAALRRAGEPERALEAFDAALAADPGETAALVGRADLLCEQGANDPGEIASLLERAISLDPEGLRPESRRAKALVASLASRVV